MKQRILHPGVLVVLLSCCLSAQAQSETPAALPDRVRFGIKAGLTYSNTNFNRGFPTPPTPVATSWQPGFLAGFLVQIPVRNKFLLQQEYSYVRMGGKVKATGTEYRFDYLSLPVLLKYELLPRLSLLAGPQFDLLINAQQKGNGVSLTTTHDTEERSLGATGGAEYKVYKNIRLTARYTHGLNHIGIGQRSDITEFKFESVHFSTDFTF